MKTVFVAATMTVLTQLAAFGTAAGNPLPVNPCRRRVAVENVRDQKVIALSAAELAKLKHAELKAGPNVVTFSGVPLAEVLTAAGVTWGEIVCACWRVTWLSRRPTVTVWPSQSRKLPRNSPTR